MSLKIALHLFPSCSSPVNILDIFLSSDMCESKRVQLSAVFQVMVALSLQKTLNQKVLLSNRVHPDSTDFMLIMTQGFSGDRGEHRPPPFGETYSQLNHGHVLITLFKLHCFYYQYPTGLLPVSNWSIHMNQKRVFFYFLNCHE